jgi:hypothetical protein
MKQLATLSLQSPTLPEWKTGALRGDWLLMSVAPNM